MHPGHQNFWQTPIWRRGLTAVLGTIGLVLLITGGLLWHRANLQYQRRANLNRQLQSASRQGLANLDETQLQQLVSAARALGQPLPEAGYAGLYNRWLAAVARFDQVSAALGNRYLEPRARQTLNALHQDLLALRNACQQSLATEGQLPAELAWKIHNLKANVSVLLAYSVLYHEQEGRKAARFLTDALEDYKSAIDQVDRARTTSLKRTLPRWNLELITGIGEYSKIGFAEIPRADMDRVRDQLQAFIPETPGFSPGIPLETRVEK